MRDFAAEGIPTDHPLARKLWLASKILGEHVAGGPFGKPLTDYTLPELDFVLEMAALEDPDRYSFIRNGKESGRSGSPEAMARWTDVLMGPTLLRYIERIGLSVGIKATAAWRSRRSAGLQPGLTRGGKPLDAGN